MSKSALLATLLILCLTGTPALAQKLPDTIVHSPEVLYKTKKRVLERDPQIMPAYRQLIREADQALKRKAQTVVYKPAPPPGGKPHDYWSIDPYYWPNPDTWNALPPVMRDGERNPEADSANYDRKRLQQTADDALTLALAWYLSGNEQYAGKGAALVFAWCGDSMTRMTPHMKFARMRPGAKPGAWLPSPRGIAEGRDLIKLVEAARILEPSFGWTRAVSNKVRAWFKAYVKWLRESPLGAKASVLPDGPAVWYDAQLAVFSLFTGDENLTRGIVGSLTPSRLYAQAAPNGALFHELERARSRQTTYSTLEAFFTLAAVGERVGLDLWHQRGEGASLKKIFDYAAPYLAPDKTWPFGHVGEYDPFRFTPLFHRAAMVYKEDRYRDILTGLPQEKLLTDRAQLFY